MRSITLIIIHCSAVGPDQISSAAKIEEWHKERGFKCIGYHYVIRRDGTIELGRPEWQVGAHCHVKGQNHNKHSIGVCYEGGLDIRGQPADTRTAEQKQTMRRLLEDLHERYPRAMIVGHRDLIATPRSDLQVRKSPGKDCPCFDAVHEYADLQPK